MRVDVRSIPREAFPWYYDILNHAVSKTYALGSGRLTL
jgi:hypothetical protein